MDETVAIRNRREMKMKHTESQIKKKFRAQQRRS